MNEKKIALWGFFTTLIMFNYCLHINVHMDLLFITILWFVFLFIYLFMLVCIIPVSYICKSMRGHAVFVIIFDQFLYFYVLHANVSFHLNNNIVIKTISYYVKISLKIIKLSREVNNMMFFFNDSLS